MAVYKMQPCYKPVHGTCMPEVPVLAHFARLRNGYRGRLSSCASGTATLEGWLAHHGGVVSGVALSQREVRATEALESGRLLVAVPRACQLRYDDVDDPALRDLFDRVPHGPKGTSEGAWQFKQALAVREPMRPTCHSVILRC